jgi:hypothetical protein
MMSCHLVINDELIIESETLILSLQIILQWQDFRNKPQRYINDYLFCKLWYRC